MSFLCKDSSIVIAIFISVFVPSVSGIYVKLINLTYSRNAICKIFGYDSYDKIQFFGTIKQKVFLLPKRTDNSLSEFDNDYILNNLRVYYDYLLKVRMVFSPYAIPIKCEVTINGTIYSDNGVLPKTAWPQVRYTQINESAWKCTNVPIIYNTFVYCLRGRTKYVIPIGNKPHTLTPQDKYILDHINVTHGIITYSYLYMNYSFQCTCLGTMQLEPYDIETEENFLLPHKTKVNLLTTYPRFPKLARNITCKARYGIGNGDGFWNCEFCSNPNRTDHHKEVCENTYWIKNVINYDFYIQEEKLYCRCFLQTLNFYPEWTNQLFPIPFSSFDYLAQNIPMVIHKYLFLIFIWVLIIYAYFFELIRIYQTRNIHYIPFVNFLYFKYHLFIKSSVQKSEIHKKYVLIGEPADFKAIKINTEKQLQIYREIQRKKQLKRQRELREMKKKEKLNRQMYVIVHDEDRQSEVIPREEMLKRIQRDKITLEAPQQKMSPRIDSRVSVKPRKLSSPDRSSSILISRDIVPVYRDEYTRVSVRESRAGSILFENLERLSTERAAVRNERTKKAGAIRSQLKTFASPINYYFLEFKKPN